VNAQTKAADVLAVMEEAARSLWVEGEPVNPHAAGLIRVRIAVAELIEADKEYDAARADFDRCALYRPEWRRICLRLDNAVALRRAALARVGGAQ
jgi:hypothetical protein